MDSLVEIPVNSLMCEVRKPPGGMSLAHSRNSSWKPSSCGTLDEQYCPVAVQYSYREMEDPADSSQKPNLPSDSLVTTSPQLSLNDFFLATIFSPGFNIQLCSHELLKLILLSRVLSVL